MKGRHLSGRNWGAKSLNQLYTKQTFMGLILFGNQTLWHATKHSACVHAGVCVCEGVHVRQQETAETLCHADSYVTHLLTFSSDSVQAVLRLPVEEISE